MPTTARRADRIFPALLLAASGCVADAPASPPRQAGGGDAGGTSRAQTYRVWPPDRPGYVNPIPAENARPGDPSWSAGPVATKHEVELYADQLSVRAGAWVTVMVSSDVAHGASWVLYRIGWYGGDGARRVDQGGPVQIGPQSACPPSVATALVRCAWTPTFTLQVPPDAVSGLYAIRVTREDGFFSMAPVVVVDDRPADLLAQASVDTWQAYNPYAGESLYMDATGTMPAGEAIQVSFDRPYATGAGLGRMRDDDMPIARFLERHGYDVTYTTNARVAARDAAELLRAGAFISGGHDEYWAGEERQAADAALVDGVPLLFFGANAVYWKVRYEAWADAENPRVITCYKGRTPFDPMQDENVTGLFRESPIDQPENALIGTMYESWMNLAQRWVVADDRSWLFAGTGLVNGDAIPFLIGYEYDRVYENGATPAGLAVVGRSPVVDAEGKASVSETVTYRAPSGALVFGAASMIWAGGLGGGERYDGRVARMVANVFHEAIGLPIPDSVVNVPPMSLQPPQGPFASSVATIATGLDRPTSIAVLPDGSLAVVETGRHRVVRVSRAGEVSLIAGDGQEDPPSDGPGATARFHQPVGVLALADGSLLVADSKHQTIRRIANDGQHTVTTVAGAGGWPGFADGPGATARFSFPMSLVQDPVTRRILVADNANNRVRALDPATWQVTTLVGGSGWLADVDGPAAGARLVQPSALAAAPDGRVFVIATGGYRIKVILPDAARTVVTLAGGAEGYADGTGTEARLSPQGGAAFTNGALYFSDPGSLTVRALVPGTSAAGSTVHTVAGSGRSLHADGPGGSASFTLPLGLAAAADGTLYVVDAAAGAIRAIRP